MHGYALKTAKYFNRENFGSFKFVRSPIQVILAQINFWRIGKIRHEVKRWVWRLTESLWQDLTSLQLPWPALLITSAMGLDQPDWYTFDGLVLRRKKVLISPSTQPLIDFHCLAIFFDLQCTILVLTTSLEFSNCLHQQLFGKKHPVCTTCTTSDMKRWQEIIDGWQKCGSCVG